MTIVDHNGLLREDEISMFSNGMVERTAPTWGFAQGDAAKAVLLLEWMAARTRSIEHSDVSYRTHVATIAVHLDWPGGRQEVFVDYVGFGELDFADVRDAVLEFSEDLSWTDGRAPVSPELRGQGKETWR